MTSKKAYITGIGHFHPPKVLDNHFFSDLGIGSEAGWIEDRTGIKSRSTVLDIDSLLNELRDVDGKEGQKRRAVYSLADMGEQAFLNLSKRFPFDLQAHNIDLIVCGTSVPDFDIPSNASLIAKRLGFQTTAVDINAACSSFLFDLHFVSMAVRAGQCKRALIFNPERYTLRLNFRDRASCVLFGDGASAVLVEDSLSGPGLEILDLLVGSDPLRAEVIKIPVGGFFEQNGPAVQRFAVMKTVEITRNLLKAHNLDFSDLGVFIGHQANLRMLQSAITKMELNHLSHFYNVDRFGNQGAAGAPISLSQNWQNIKNDEYLAMSVVGAGLAWGTCLLKSVNFQS